MEQKQALQAIHPSAGQRRGGNPNVVIFKTSDPDFFYELSEERLEKTCPDAVINLRPSVLARIFRRRM